MFPRVAFEYGHVAMHRRRPTRVMSVPAADHVEGAAEARRIAGGEQMLGRGARLARASDLLRSTKIDIDGAIIGRGVPVAPATCCRVGGEQGLDDLHACLLRSLVCASQQQV